MFLVYFQKKQYLDEKMVMQVLTYIINMLLLITVILCFICTMMQQKFGQGSVLIVSSKAAIFSLIYACMKT